MCDDGNPCTIDTCGLARCEHIPTDSLCDDANVCNGVETCDLILGCVE
ncbi:MAG: hypothetical protein H6765_10550 [Candidatus Peribacteria bacterium]|nr:MAG: hypothetical protein H6765_10550 [Candidatus Peribacteria bacterium]